VLLQLAFEALEEREGVRRAAGEAGDHLVVVELAHLACVALHDGVAERHLAVAGQRDDAVAPHAKNGRAVWIESLRVGHPILSSMGAKSGVLPRCSAHRGPRPLGTDASRRPKSLPAI